MNRLSFLKTVAGGIAAGLISGGIVEKTERTTPVPVKKSLPIKIKQVPLLKEWELVIDKSRRMWTILFVGETHAEISAVEMDPLPNYLKVRKDMFWDYFAPIKIIVTHKGRTMSAEEKRRRR